MENVIFIEGINVDAYITFEGIIYGTSNFKEILKIQRSLNIYIL